MVKGIKVKSLHRLVTHQPILLKRDTPIDEIAKKILINPVTHSFYVIDDEARLVGKITLAKLVEHLFGDIILENSFDVFLAIHLSSKKKAGDIMMKPIYVTPEATLKDAFLKMHQNNLLEMPVVDEDMRVLGDLNLIELIAALVEKRERAKGKQYLHMQIDVPFFDIIHPKR